MLTVLDTNVVISALLFRGENARILRAVLEGRVVPLVSSAIINEYVRLLSYPKLSLTDSEIQYLIQEELRPWFPLLTERVPEDAWISEDPTDDHFINAAKVRPNTLLISGDRHILRYRNTLPVTVRTARELLDELELQ